MIHTNEKTVVIFTGPLKRRGGVQILVDLGCTIARETPVVMVAEETSESSYYLSIMKNHPNVYLFLKKPKPLFPILHSAIWTMKIAWRFRRLSAVASAPQILLPVWIGGLFGRNLVYIVQGVETLKFGLAGLLSSILVRLNLLLPVRKKIAMTDSIHQELQRLSILSENGVRPWLSKEFMVESSIPKVSGRQFDFGIFYSDSFLKGGDRLQPLIEFFPGKKFLVFSNINPNFNVESENVTWCVGLLPSEVYAKLKQVKLMISISRYEGFGLPIEEALICGCAVVGFYNRGIENFFHHPLFLKVITDYHDIERSLDEAILIGDEIYAKQVDTLKNDQIGLPNALADAVCT